MVIELRVGSSLLAGGVRLGRIRRGAALSEDGAKGTDRGHFGLKKKVRETKQGVQKKSNGRNLIRIWSKKTDSGEFRFRSSKRFRRSPLQLNKRSRRKDRWLPLANLIHSVHYTKGKEAVHTKR